MAVEKPVIRIGSTIVCPICGAKAFSMDPREIYCEHWMMGFIDFPDGSCKLDLQITWKTPPSLLTLKDIKPKSYKEMLSWVNTNLDDTISYYDLEGILPCGESAKCLFAFHE